MAAKSIWMVRAGQGAQYVDEFLEDGLVAIGWVDAGPFSENIPKEAIETKLASVSRPHTSPGTLGTWASQIKRYYDEIKIGDAVCTYDPSPRLYLIGTIESKVEHRDHPLSRVRKVKWTRKAVRDSLKQETRNTLGAIATFFQIRDAAAEDLWDRSVPIDADLSVSEPEGLIETDGDNKVLLDEVATKAMELIEDRIARLDWEEMQQLVAELLIAMGYRARISPKGADRGRDIFASPDGLGMQEPRIFVEVKHRLGSQMGSNEIRAFLGGRQPGDRCLYVSTGGFTKEARYEAERSSIPITLITLPELRELLVEHYESLRPLGTSLVPLERLYWPTN